MLSKRDVPTHCAIIGPIQWLLGCKQTLIVSDGFEIGSAPLNVRHDERADRAVITSVPETHMAMVVLTWLHLFALEQVAGRDIEPAGTCLHQLITGDREAIHIAAAGKRIPRMRERRDGGNQRCNNE